MGLAGRWKKRLVPPRLLERGCAKLLIVDDVAAGGSPVDEELQTCMSEDRDIYISVVSFAGTVCVVPAHITDDIGTIWDRLKRESAKVREVLPKHISFFIGTSAMEVSDISSLLHVADAQRMVTLIVTRNLTILQYYFKVWLEDDCPFLVDSSSSDQAEHVVNVTITEDTDSDSSDDVWETTIMLLAASSSEVVVAAMPEAAVMAGEILVGMAMSGAPSSNTDQLTL